MSSNKPPTSPPTKKKDQRDQPDEVNTSQRSQGQGTQKTASEINRAKKKRGGKGPIQIPKLGMQNKDKKSAAGEKRIDDQYNELSQLISGRSSRMSDTDQYQAANIGSSELVQSSRSYQAFMAKMENLKDVKKEADEKIVKATALDGDLQQHKMQYVYLKKSQNKIKRGLGVLTVVFMLNVLFGGREGPIFIDKFGAVIKPHLASVDMSGNLDKVFTRITDLILGPDIHPSPPNNGTSGDNETDVIDPVVPKTDDPKKEDPPKKPDPKEPQPKVECKMGPIQVDQYGNMKTELLLNLELVTNQIKRASNHFFKFDVVNDSLLDVNLENAESEKMVQRYLEVIYWLHFHSQAGFKKGPRPRPQNDKLNFKRIKGADFIHRYSKEMTEVAIDDSDGKCEITMPRLSDENFHRLQDRLSFIKDTYIGFDALVSNKDSLKMSIESLQDLIATNYHGK